MRRFIIFGGVILIILVAGAAVLSRSDTAVATLMVAEGQATVIQNRSRLGILPANTTATLPPGSIITISQGDVIQQNSGMSQLRLQDGTVIDLAPGAVLRIDELIIASSDYRVKIHLLAGKTINRVVRLLGPADYFRISTPSSTAAVRGTVFSVEVITTSSTHVSVDEGIVRVTMRDDFVDVLAGQMVTAVIGQPLQVMPQTGAPATNNAPTGNNTESTIPESPTATNSGTLLITTTALPSSTATNAAVQPTSSRPTAVIHTPTLVIPATVTTATPSSTTTAVSTLPATTEALPPTPTMNIPIPAATTQPATNTPLPTAVPSPTLVAPPTATPPPPPTEIPSPVPPTAEPATPIPQLVTLCHIPGGNPENAQTIQVPPEDVDGHLAHGDYLGPCQ